MGTFLLSWLAYPLVLLVLSLGIGLLVRRIASPDVLPGMLLVPVGFAGIVTVVAFPTQLSTTAPLAGVLVLILAAGGVLWARSELLRTLRPSRGWLWPGVAALLPAGSIAAPIVLTGQAGLTGYGRVVDIAHQLMLTAWLSTEGRTVPVEGLIDSSYLRQAFQLTNVGYPGGSQAALGATSGLVGLDPLWTYQVFLAALAAMLGVALFSLLETAIPSAPWRALAAGVSAQPTILFSYALVGGIKELGAVATVALAAAVLMAHPPSVSRPRQVVPAAIAVAASLAVFNIGIVPWLGTLVAVVLAADLVRRPRRWRTFGRWILLGVVTVALTVPTLLVAVRLAPVAASGGPPDLGNLAAPVPVWSALGPWWTTDYRYPLPLTGRGAATYIAIGVTLVLAALGVARAARRVDVRLLALTSMAVVALAYVSSRAGPWVDLKAFAITAPISVALAFAGAWTLARWRRLPWAAPVTMTIVAATVLFGNALVYYGTSVTPYERFAELERLGEKYAGQGPALFPAFEEFGEYLLREVRTTGSVNPPQSRFELAGGARPGQQFSRDPDEIALGFLNEFDLLVLRRDPTGSRPPSNWSLDERTEFYEVWRRSEEAPRVVRHFPLAGQSGERDRAFCRNVGAVARAARGQALIAYSEAPNVVQYTAEEGSAPTQWMQYGPDFVAAGPGRLKGSVTLPRPARYNLWLRGSFGRTVRVVVDGKEVGSVRWQESYPQQYAPVGSVVLSAGEHAFQIVRSGGTLLPGTGNEASGDNQGPGGLLTTVGPLAFAFPRGGPRLHFVEPTEFGDLCRSKNGLDWVEVVVPGDSSVAPRRPGAEAGFAASLSPAPPAP